MRRRDRPTTMAQNTNGTAAGLSLQLAPDALEPLIRRVVEETLARLEEDRARLGDRLAYSEAEAAALLALEPHQLRDERRRGRVTASVGPGRKILYSRGDLTRYLLSPRGGGGTATPPAGNRGAWVTAFGGSGRRREKLYDNFELRRQGQHDR